MSLTPTGGSGWCRENEDRPSVVYRMYDANCVLLYVGMSLNLTSRLGNHASRTGWWTDVDTISVEHFPTRSAALEAERIAISTEAPLHNVRHQGARPKGFTYEVTPRFEVGTDGFIAVREYVEVKR